MVGPPDEERPHERRIAALDAVLDRLVARRGVRHALVAVDGGDGVFGWSGARGVATADGAPMEVDTLFPLASVTKLYTGVLALGLVEEGRLDLDAPVTSVRPDLTGLHAGADGDLTSRVTVRHLLTHTSGLPDYYLDAPADGPNLHQRLVAEGDRPFTFDEVVEVVRRLPPHFPPARLDGSGRVRARYSDTNFQVLGALVTEVTGQPFGAALRERVLAPAGLAHTFLAGEVRPDETVASIWAGDAELQPARALASMGPDGGLVATIGDVLRFARALFSGAVFDDESTLARMQERWYRFGFPRDRTALLAPGWPVEYGLGIMRYRLPRLLSPLRPVPPVYGHTGATGTWLFHCPAWAVTVAGTVGQVTAAGVPYRVAPRLLRASRSRDRGTGSAQ